MAVDVNGQPGRPKMSLGGEMSDGYGEFLGVVITDAWEQGKFGWQWHLAVKPVEFELKGESGAFHSWYRHSTRKNSAMGAARVAMQEIFPADLEIGEGKLVGTAGWWKRETLTFGTNQQTGEEMKAEGVLIPLKLASAEESERAKQRGGTGPTPATAPVAAATADALGDEELEQVKRLVNGLNKGEIQKAAMADKSLNRSIRQGLISGKLLTQLIEQGELVLDEESGVYSEMPF